MQRILNRDLRMIYGSQSQDNVPRGGQKEGSGALNSEQPREGQGSLQFRIATPDKLVSLSLHPLGLSARRLHQSETEAELEAPGRF